MVDGLVVGCGRGPPSPSSRRNQESLMRGRRQKRCSVISRHWGGLGLEAGGGWGA
jgi:hypothetical protein